jgi:hypothetical protein
MICERCNGTLSWKVSSYLSAATQHDRVSTRAIEIELLGMILRGIARPVVPNL